MAVYKVFFKKSVEKDFDGILKKDLSKIIKRIGELADNPRPPGCEKLTGQDRYRLRQGRYRAETGTLKLQAQNLIISGWQCLCYQL